MAITCSRRPEGQRRTASGANPQLCCSTRRPRKPAAVLIGFVSNEQGCLQFIATLGDLSHIYLLRRWLLQPATLPQVASSLADAAERRCHLVHPYCCAGDNHPRKRDERASTYSDYCHQSDAGATSLRCEGARAPGRCGRDSSILYIYRNCVRLVIGYGSKRYLVETTPLFQEISDLSARIHCTSPP